MADRGPRKADHKRWRRDIVRHREELPRQYAALETAMAAFGDNFDMQPFKEAFTTTEDVGGVQPRSGRRAGCRPGAEFVAGDVHRAAELVHDTARDFIGRYGAWIEPYLG